MATSIDTAWYETLKFLGLHAEEQKKIGEYFGQTWITLITLHRRAYYNEKGELTNVHNDN